LLIWREVRQSRRNTSRRRSSTGRGDSSDLGQNPIAIGLWLC
jgi:hypothetical protein